MGPEGHPTVQVSPKKYFANSMKIFPLSEIIADQSTGRQHYGPFVSFFYTFNMRLKSNNETLFY